MKAFITRHRKLLIAGILIAAALGVFFMPQPVYGKPDRSWLRP